MKSPAPFHDSKLKDAAPAAATRHHRSALASRQGCVVDLRLAASHRRDLEVVALPTDEFTAEQLANDLNGLVDHHMQWDFWTLSPESAHQVTWLMGDRGIPKSWRHMNGYSSHTYSWLNADGELFWVEYRFKTVLLRRRAPRPARSELQADPGQHPQGRGAQLLQGMARCESAM